MARLTRAQAADGVDGYSTNRLLAIPVSATNPDGTPYSLPVTSATPLAADVLCGRQVFTATTAATTLITVPAGRVWVGHVGASVACASTSTATPASRASAEISTAGTGVTPAAGVYLGVDALVGANAATGATGTGESNANAMPLTVVAPVGNSVTVQVACTITGTTGRVDAFASGSLVAQ